MDGIPAYTSPELLVLPTRVFVAEAVVQATIRAAAYHDEFETGGLVLGYRSRNNELVILDGTGAGPKARHGRFTFVPDGPWQRERLADVYEATAGLATYLGDWHTHPGGLAVPSKQDVETAANVAATPAARTPQPLTLIAGVDEDRLSFAAYVFDGSDLVAVPISRFTPRFEYRPSLPGFPEKREPSLIETLMRPVRGAALTAVQHGFSSPLR